MSAASTPIGISKSLYGEGRNAVVVGATSGIGRACAIRLAESGFTVTAVGRDAQRGEAVIESMKTMNKQRKQEPKEHRFISCDAFSLKNIEKCAQEITSKGTTVDILVMSQGMATIQGFTPTAEGNDQKLTLHYWGRMAMITQLLPSLRTSSDPRVVSVLSGGVHSPFANFRQDTELKNGSYSIKNAADAAGFYNDLGLDALAKDSKNKNIIFVHAAPGFVKTNWGTEMPFWIRYPVRALQVFGKSAKDCAENMCYPCITERTDLFQKLGTGVDSANSVLIMNESARPGNKTSLHSEEASQFLWEKTKEVLQRASVSIP